MMGGRDRSHCVDPRPFEDGIIGGLDVEVTRLYDDVERINAIGNLTIETGFALIKIIEE